MTDKKKFNFELLATDPNTQARLGQVSTSHGIFPTPIFMPVGTRAVVRTMTPRDLKEAGSRIILANTYHLAVRPGEKQIEKFGKLHKFMAWDGPILTDSGGFQVFSLADLRKMNDDGVIFRSHVNGDLYNFTPEKVVEIQQCLGSDIIMPLDHCIGWPCTYDQAKLAMTRTLSWLKRSAKINLEPDQAMFGIVQGSIYPDLREYCAKAMRDLDMPGYSIGGLAVGEDKLHMKNIIEIVNAILPENKPRYLMGVGTPEDLVMAVARGVDMFDCVMPTRNARSGGFFTWDGKRQIRNAIYRDSQEPLDQQCPCYCCQTFTRGYLHHLFSKKVEEITGMIMLTLHNLTFYLNLTGAMREAIAQERFDEFQKNFFARYRKE
ncbi:MAG TPA: tRNA guanosine(34) transglycosylase Tgt [Planctomycetota bacterium]|nr:tRNA guanosine(34) transglycosylase Tgt [Planctomycetota bacterium]